MKIIITVTNDLNYDRRMQRIASSLVKAGNEVLLIGVKRKSSVPLESHLYRQKRIAVIFQKGKLFYIEYNIRLFFYLLFKKADLFYAVDLDTVLPNYFVSGMKGKELVYDAHEIFPEVPELMNRPLVKRIWERIEKFILNRSKNNLTVSESLKDWFEKKYKGRFTVIRNVPMRRTTPVATPLNDHRIILYQGALNKGRGIEPLILAAKEVKAVFHLCGEGDLSDFLRSMVREERLEHKIFFKGNLLPDQLQKETAQAYIGVNLLENLGKSYYYSLSNKFFDYIQAGKPSISMCFPEYERVQNEFETGILLEDLNPATVAGALNNLLLNTNKYETLKMNCMQASKVFCWEQEEILLHSFFEKLI